ncbi:hypothetical protein KPH14_013127 [Odynerus spinipes]|uniref:Uncharacterized protein n=1 Tax=Odynerus spinipes TaxID=1348599 RepID=A0AAD9VHH5_9HYME|nr:hypothetical protein KPH14_013127 [Odynerus spinipes]
MSNDETRNTEIVVANSQENTAQPQLVERDGYEPNMEEKMAYAEERERERSLHSAKLEAEEGGVSRDDESTIREENLRKNYQPLLRDVRKIRVEVPRVLSIFRKGFETNDDDIVSFPLTVVRVKENVEYFTQDEQIARINFAKILEIMRGTNDPWIKMLTQIIDCLVV